MLNITHPDDHALLKQQLIPKDLHTLFAAKTDENGEIRSRTKEEEDEIDLKLREDRRDFKIRYVHSSANHVYLRSYPHFCPSYDRNPI